MSNGDLTRFDAITELPARTCLTFLEFTLDKAEVEKAHIKNQSRF